MTAWWESSPVVDVQPDLRVWWRRIKRSVRLGAALVRVWWPVVVPVLVFDRVGVGRVSSVAAVAIIVGCLVLVVPRVRAWWLSLPAATLESLFRARWPRICADASVVAAVNGAVRHPTLVSVRSTGVGWRYWKPVGLVVSMHPLGTQDKETWPRIASRLGQHLGFASATPRALDTELEVTLVRHRLPDTVTVGEDVPLEAIAPDPAHIHFGDSALGETIRWSLDDPTRPHALVAGGTGGGKGNAARIALVWAWLQLRAGRLVLVLVANPKRAGEFRWCTPWAAVASTTGGICAQIDWVHAQMTARGVVCEEHGVDHFSQLPEALQAQLGGRLLFILDEWSDFITDPFLPDPKKVMGRVVSLVRKGRSLGINIMANGQHITGEMFSPANAAGTGTAMIGSMTTRLAVGSIEASGAKTLFGSESVAAMANGDIPGRAFTRGMGSRPGGQEAVPAQVWLVPRELVMALGPPVDELAAPPSFDEIAAQAAQAAAQKADLDQGADEKGRGRNRNRKAVL